MTVTDVHVPTLTTPAAALAVAGDLAGEIAGGAVQRELDGVWPVDALRAVSGSGLLSILVPTRFGGPDLPRATAVEVLRILSRADSAVGQLLLSHYVLSAAIRGLGDADPAPRLYADILAGVETGAALAHDDRAGRNGLAAEHLHAEHLGLRVAAVAG